MSDTVWRPSCVCNFNVLFDDTLLSRIGNPPRSLSATQTIRHPATGSTFRQYQPSAIQSTQSNADNAQQISFIVGRQPKRCNIEFPSLRQAGTFDLSFDFRELPVDPRTIRSMAVEIHMGTVTDDNFAAGMNGTYEAGRALASQIRIRNQRGESNDSTIMLVGTVDEADIDFGAQGSEISIRGRDLRGILLDSPLDPTIFDHLDLSKTINEVIRDLLAGHPVQGRLRVVTRASDWPDSVIPACLPQESVARHRRGARGRRRGGRGHSAGSAQMSYWDAITHLCFLVGAMPIFLGSRLEIKPVRSVFQQNDAQQGSDASTPFNPDRPRAVEGMAPYSIRRMVYGRNIEKVSFKRQFAGAAKPKEVRCISAVLDMERRGTDMQMEASWPPRDPAARRAALGVESIRRPAATLPQRTALGARQPAGALARANRPAADNQAVELEVINVPVPGITSLNRLANIARAIYEEIGRNELGGHCDTKALASFGGDNSDPDLLRMRPGDAVEIMIDHSTNHGSVGSAASPGTAQDHYRQPFEAQVQEISERIGDPSFARAIVASSRGAVNQLQRIFRASSVSYTWEITSGVQVSFDFQNYYVVRYDVEVEGAQPLIRETVVAVPERTRDDNERARTRR